MISLAIVGAQALTCTDDREKSAERIHQAIAKLKPDLIISGGAKGVDALAFAIAVDLGYREQAGTLVVHRPICKSWEGYGGYKWRNGKIAEECTHLLRIGCKRSKTYGSGWTADKAEALGKEVVRWNPCS